MTSGDGTPFSVGGLEGLEIGRLMGLDYSMVSQGRKRFRDYLMRRRKGREDFCEG